MVRTLYDILLPLETKLKIAHKHGARIPQELLRDIEIYRDFSTMAEKSKMQRYTDLAEKYCISESIVRDTIRSMKMIIED